MKLKLMETVIETIAKQSSQGACINYTHKKNCSTKPSFCDTHESCNLVTYRLPLSNEDNDSSIYYRIRNKPF